MQFTIKYSIYEKRGDRLLPGKPLYRTIEIDEDKVDDDQYVDQFFSEEIDLPVEAFKIMEINE